MKNLRCVQWPARSIGLPAAICVGLTGCGQDLSKSLGLTRDAPDEFTVTTRAPLVMPSTFELPPPRPGTRRPQELPESVKAEQTLVPQMALDGAPTASETPGQMALLQQSGPPAPPNIRSRVNAEVGEDTPKRPFTDRLMFWKDPPPPGTVVDPTREAQRLRANAALGQSVDSGDTPIIQPKRQSMFGNLF